MWRIAIILALPAAVGPGAVAVQAVDTREGKRLTSAAKIEVAQRFARARQGEVAFAVLGEHGKRVRAGTHDPLPLRERVEGDDARVGPVPRRHKTPERNAARQA
jgi:hypothetical protein